MLATGLYTIPEAARLAHMKPDQVRRCVLGYANQPSLWCPELPIPIRTKGGRTLVELGFSDLIELRFVREFLNRGVSFRVIRLCLSHAQSVLNSERPLTSEKARKLLETDGTKLFLSGIQGDSEATLDLKTLQMVMRVILKPTFLDIEYDAHEAVRWFPLHGSKAIVLDKNIAFGKPIAAGYGVPTEALAIATKAEGSTLRVARLYNIPEGVVKEALKFEVSLQ